jgi:hypothetical protein
MATAEAKTLLRVALRDLQIAQLLEVAPAPESSWVFILKNVWHQRTEALVDHVAQVISSMP